MFQALALHRNRLAFYITIIITDKVLVLINNKGSLMSFSSYFPKNKKKKMLMNPLSIITLFEFVLFYSKPRVSFLFNYNLSLYNQFAY